MQLLTKITGRISNTAFIVSAIVVLAMLLLTVADVIGRGVFSQPVLGTYEISKYMLVVVVLFGIAWAERSGQNIRVELFISKLPPAGRLVADAVFTIITITLVVFIIWQGWLEGINSITVGTNSDIWHIPEYPFRFIICLGAFLLLIELILKLINITIFHQQYSKAQEEAR